MAARKTPILLRRGPMTGTVQAIHRYRKVPQGDSYMIESALDGKQDVQADFDALMLEVLMGDAPHITAALDGAAKGMELDEDERQQIENLRLALVRVIERHNTTGHGAP